MLMLMLFLFYYENTNLKREQSAITPTRLYKRSINACICIDDVYAAINTKWIRIEKRPGSSRFTANIQWKIRTTLHTTAPVFMG